MNMPFSAAIARLRFLAEREPEFREEFESAASYLERFSVFEESWRGLREFWRYACDDDPNEDPQEKGEVKT